MSHTLDAKLLLADHTFLTTLSGGATAIDAFTRLWADIQESLDLAIEQNAISTATLMLARQVTDRVQLVTERFLELYDEMDAFSPALFELKSLFNELSLEEESRAATYKPVINDLTATLTSIPPYIQSAYAWLLDNLHNPYPSKDMKMLIAKGAGSSLKYVESWFQDARKRIGWTSLCQSRFSNKRSLIVQAATQCLKRGATITTKVHSVTNLDDTVEFDQAFHQIEYNAKQLYEGKIRASSLATNIDSMTKSTTPRSPSASRDRDSATPSNPSFFYPSPQNSSQPSSPIVPAISPATPVNLSQSNTGKKRRARSPDYNDEEGRIAKRSRNDSRASKPTAPEPSSPRMSRSVTPITTHLGPVSLPSLPAVEIIPSISRKRKRSIGDDEHHRRKPSPFHHVNDQASPEAQEEDPAHEVLPMLPINNIPSIQELPIPTPDSVSVARKRKRRLSESSDHPYPKRPHNALITPRHQAVSDPLPMTQFLSDEWWPTDLSADLTTVQGSDLPAVDIFSQTEPLDVRFDNYYNDLFNIPVINLPEEDTPSALPAGSPNPVNIEAINPMYLSLVPAQGGQKPSFDVPSDLFSNSGLDVSLNEATYGLLESTFTGHDLPSQLSLPTQMPTQQSFPIANDFSAFSSTLGFPDWTGDGPLPFQPNLLNFSFPLDPLPLSNDLTAHPDDTISKHELAKRLREQLHRLEADLANDNQPL